MQLLAGLTLHDGDLHGYKLLHLTNITNPEKGTPMEQAHNESVMGNAQEGLHRQDPAPHAHGEHPFTP